MDLSRTGKRNKLSRRSAARLTFWHGDAATRWLNLLWLGCALGMVAEAAPNGGPPFSEPHSRVIIVQNPAATDAFEPRAQVVLGMVNRALTNLTRKPTPAEAWRSLVATQDTVGLKVYCAPGPNSGTRPAVVAAIVEGLLAAGLPPTNIVVWDKEKRDLIRSGYLQLASRYGIEVEGSAAVGYDEKTFYERPLLGHLMYNDLEFGKEGEGVGRKSFVSKLVSKRLTKIINITPLLNHYRVGVTGNLYSLSFGSVDNTFRFEHEPDGLAQAVPEIYALEALWDKVVLNVVDALICQYEGQSETLLQYSVTLNELRFSRDPVALDVLSLMELEQQRPSNSKALAMTNSMKLYDIANVIGLGTSNPRHIEVERMKQ